MYTGTLCSRPIHWNIWNASEPPRRIVLCRTALQACLWRTATFDIDSAELHLCIFRFPSQPPALRQGSGSVPALLSFRGLKSQYIDTMSLCLAWWQPLFKQEENPSKAGSCFHAYCHGSRITPWSESHGFLIVFVGRCHCCALLLVAGPGSGPAKPCTRRRLPTSTRPHVLTYDC